ncbi:MAG: TonB-dependent receptor [Opitutus sp.]|nr:TonB-dependent receptor [Opitutus sp.]
MTTPSALPVIIFPGSVFCRRCVYAAAILSLISAGDAKAQGAAQPTAGERPRQGTARTGSVTGRVQNIATGQYLNNAQVSVRNTSLVTLTDQSGNYRLTHVPSGPVVLDVYYTGLDPRQVPLELVAGGTVIQNIDLTSVARYGEGAGVVKLDAFVLSASRETNAMAIATNEQRFAPNIKLVVSADSYGDVMDGNVVELMKFLPGVTAVYDRGDDPSSVSRIGIRGFSSSMVAISSDGAQMANTSNATGDSRAFSFSQVTINNLSRVEVVKVPTPATPADSMAGSVNMISKSAFERKGASLHYSLDLTGSTLDFHPGRTPHTNDERIYKILPGLTFDYTLPVNRDFGIVVTGVARYKYIKLQESRITYNATAAGTGASPARPFLQTYQMSDQPAEFDRHSIGVKVDWRATPNSVLSLGVQATHYEIRRYPTNFTVSPGTVATPLPAPGVSMTFGDDFVQGATGRGSVTTANAASTDRVYDSVANTLSYRLDDGHWRILAGANHSVSKGGIRDVQRGHFRQLGVALINPVRVAFTDINAVRPGKIQVFDNNNREVDIYNIDNYRLTTSNSTPRHTRETIDGGNLDLRKQLDFLPVPTAVQIGGMQRLQSRDTRRQSTSWTYNGTNSNLSPAPFLSPVYVNQENAFGFRNYPKISPTVAWQEFVRNPALFSKTPAQIVTEQNTAFRNSEFFQETVSALYAQAELKLLRGRLHLLGGVRYEKTTDDGQGALSDPSAVFVRNTDGTFARNATGGRIRKAEAGAVGSLEELRLVLRERAFQAHRSYDGFYPSLHLNYNLSDNLVVRLAYARTYGRPDLTQIIPNTDIAEDENVSNPTVMTGSVSVRNTGLRPWHAHNFDFSLEYYTKHGGVFSCGVFQKEISDFFGNAVRIMTLADTVELGLDPRFVGWSVRTLFNSGDARVTGVEFNLKHSLQPLGGWARHFSAFMNGTKLRLEGNQVASFGDFIPESLNWGVSFSRKPIIFMAKWNYRGRETGSAQPAFGPDAFLFEDRRTTLDLNTEFQWRKQMSLFANVQNVFNEPIITLIKGSATPRYAQRSLTSNSGTTITIGLKGTF